jgi:prevent-host-death family protein
VPSDEPLCPKNLLFLSGNMQLFVFHPQQDLVARIYAKCLPKWEWNYNSAIFVDFYPSLCHGTLRHYGIVSGNVISSQICHPELHAASRLFLDDHSHMRSIAAGRFKRECIRLLDEVQAKCEPVIITKRGKPVAKLVPVDPDSDGIFGFLAGKGRIVGDVMSPVIEMDDWDRLR